MDSPEIYRFDGFTLNGPVMRLCRGSDEIQLEPKSFRLLQLLIENRERVLGKEEIFRVVWEATSVSDNALTRAVAQVRKVLGDDPKHPRYIETVPTVGYRFIGVLVPVEAPQPGQVVPVAVSSHRRPMLWIALATAAVVAAGLAAWRLLPRPSLPPVSAPTPFTSYRGNQDYPSFSPDGTQVAFDWDGPDHDNTDIYVKTLGPDATPVRLTTDPVPDTHPAWSPDGRSIAFVRMTESAKATLMLIPALGGPERRLAEFSTWNVDFGRSVTWSADSRWLIVPTHEGERSALLRVSVETGQANAITHPQLPVEDDMPAISPDGTMLLFLRHAGYDWGKLYVVRIDGNATPVEEPHRIESHDLLLGSAHWTDDGQEILAATPAQGVVRLPAEGTESPQPVPWLGPGVERFDLSRRGHRLVYSMLRADANIWRIDLTAKTPQPERLVASTFRDVYPQYSPDGRRLAFYSNRSGGRSQVWVADANGAQPRQLTFVTTGQAGSPRWSPDGKTLLIDADITGMYEIYSISADGGEVTPVTQGPSANFDKTWSRDGQWLYFTSNRTGQNEIFKMPAGGGAPVQITHNGGQKGVESEDGKTLYFAKVAGSGSVWKMPVGGGPEEQLADSLYRSNFAVAKQGIYYITNPGGDRQSTVRLYHFATGATTVVLKMGRPDFGLDVSPDGRYLAYSQLDDPASNLMLVENFH